MDYLHPFCAEAAGVEGDAFSLGHVGLRETPGDLSTAGRY